MYAVVEETALMEDPQHRFNLSNLHRSQCVSVWVIHPPPPLCLVQHLLCWPCTVVTSCCRGWTDQPHLPHVVPLTPQLMVNTISSGKRNGFKNGNLSKFIHVLLHTVPMCWSVGLLNPGNRFVDQQTFTVGFCFCMVYSVHQVEPSEAACLCLTGHVRDFTCCTYSGK